MLTPLDVIHNRELSAGREQWQRFAAATRSVFSTWEWSAVWWRHFGGHGDLVVSTVHAADGLLLGIVPLYRSRVGPLRVVRYIGHGPADEANVLYDPRLVSYSRVFAEAVSRFPLGKDLVLAERVPAQHNLTAEARATLAGRERATVIRFGGATWDAYLASRSPATREAIRRKTRRLHRIGAVQIRQTVNSQDLERDLDALFFLHRQRWPASTFGRREAFHREFAAVALSKGWLRLWVLGIHGVPAAAWYGFRYANVEQYYQAGWAPEFSRQSVGDVLLVHSIRAALEDGVEEYRFGRGDEAYKSHYINADLQLMTVAFPQSVAGSAALLASARIRRNRIAQRLRDVALEPRGRQR